MKLLALILALALPQETPFTKEDVLKLSKAGIGDEVILAKIEQEKAALKFSSADIGELKRAGVSEKVIARLTELTGRKVEDAPAPRREDPRPERRAGDGRKALVRNVSHRDVRVSVNEAD